MWLSEQYRNSHEELKADADAAALALAPVLPSDVLLHLLQFYRPPHCELPRYFPRVGYHPIGAPAPMLVGWRVDHGGLRAWVTREGYPSSLVRPVGWRAEITPLPGFA